MAARSLTMIRVILEQYREQLAYNRDMGDRFERLICAYLKLDPQYVALFSDVWLWKDWPEREQFGYQLRDTGIDLVAKLRDEDGYCAIQCKFHDSQITLSDLGSFFTLSGRGGFTRRLIVATAPLTENAAKALDGQVIPVSMLTLEDLEASPIDWSRFSLDEPDKLRKHTPKTPLPHQKEALAKVLEGFKKHDRGKLIMACGTGKTYTSLLIAQHLVKPGGHVLFLVPSIALLSQSLRAWTADASTPLRCFAVCSDSKASRDEEDIRISELAYPATTDPVKLARSMQATYDPDRLTVVFSTYQSISVVHEAQKITDVEFDLIICDEAHRTAGYTPKGEDHSAFVRVHDNEYIRGRRRLYMTATPKLYAESTKSKARNYEVEVFSMDDEATFGPEFHRLRFDEAVDRGLLSDYKVLVIAVDEYHVNRVLGVRIADEGDELRLDDAVKVLGCWHGLAKHLSEEDAADQMVDPHPMRTAIAFAGTIKNSKLFAKEFERIATELKDRSGGKLPALEARHVDGSMNVVERNQLLSWMKENVDTEEPVCRILTNARCLSEGVDVPALDAAIFLNPRDSVVDVVQSVGRVMRKDPRGKKTYGYVILPIGVRKDASPETALNDNKKYRVVWQVLNALRAHDDRLDKQFARIDLTGDKNGVVNVIGVGGGEEKVDRFTQTSFVFDPIELEKWKDAIYGKIVHKCGNRRYWEDWAKDVALIAERHEMRIRSLLENPTPKQRAAFNAFLDGLRTNLNPSIDQDTAIEMLAQHIVTKPVFDALFEGYAFTEHNPVSKSMQAILEVLESQALDKEHVRLEGFYASVRDRVSGIHDSVARQKIMVELYEKFFRTAFPRMADRLGIVYTPIEIVDFMLKSADEALKEHFGCRLEDTGVHILDPFTGTGTFIVRLIESGLLSKASVSSKYREELHANEIVLLAYYIAAINIEESFHRVVGGDYEPFPGIVLTDTFQLNEMDGRLNVDIGIPGNSVRAQEQKTRDIRVIVSNPPYSVGQSSGNDNNQNLKYEKLDKRIAETYAAYSTATLKNSLYDSYIRAFRWASDRIGDEGVICFVTNAGWVDGNTMDGFRKTLEDEFSAIYVFNLRGNARTQGEQRRKEADNVFGAGSRTPVAITLLVKKKDHPTKAKVYYYDIGDYLSREEKFAKVSAFGSYKAIPWQEITPNIYHDWINQRTTDFGGFVPLEAGSNAIFAINSNGLITNRDAWAYNFGRSQVEHNMKRMIDFYNYQVDLHFEALSMAGKHAVEVAKRRIDTDPRKIKWTRELIVDLTQNKKCQYHSDRVRVSIYRPFVKQMVYFDRRLNNCVYQMPRFYPTPEHKNLSIAVTGKGESRDFSCLIVDVLPNRHLIAGARFFPLYQYERKESTEIGSELFPELPKDDGYVRKDGITDNALERFRSYYKDRNICKEDIFYYCYGILHSPEYREQYAADLKKSLPRIPLAADFWAFTKAGRELAHWHLNYEKVDPWPVTELREPQGHLDDYAYYEVEKMTFASAGGRERNKSVIVYNSRITLEDIPLEAYEYVVNGKSAIEWIMERYAVTIDDDSGIRNDPNAWCRERGDPTYILNLLKRIIRVSMETNRIVANLPSLELEKTSA